MAVTFKALNYGEAGTGKTYSSHTLFKAGYKIRFLAAENNAISGIQKAVEAYEKAGGKLTEDQFALMIPARPKKTLAEMVQSQNNFVTVPLETQFKNADPNRKNYTRYLEILKSQISFKDTETGKDYGSVESWGPDTVLIVDSLTIICEAIMAATVGGKLAISQPEWGTMQKTLVEFMRFLTEDLKCNLIILAHPTKEVDPVLGVQRIYPDNLGQALNNKLPTYFTEVIYSYRKDKKFMWSTMHKLAVTRQTVLPLDDELEQNWAKYLPKLEAA